MAKDRELETLRREVKVLRKVCRDHPSLFEQYFHKECVQVLKKSLFFREVDESFLDEIASKMQRKVYPPGMMLKEEDTPWDRPVMFFASGRLHRWTEKDGIFQRVRSMDPYSLGSFHLLLDENTRFNVRTDTEVVAYELTRADFNELIESYPQILLPVARALANHIRSEETRHETTGLMEQRGATYSAKGNKAKTAYTATAMACFVESFYRSMMNSFLNSQLSGRPMGPVHTWFPSMHIQIPTRILYITGLKELRRIFGEIDTRDRLVSQSTLNMLLAFAPGIIMTPMSSVLEATHSQGNKEPMRQRVWRGASTRVVRELLFGVGINQLSDYCREQVPSSIQNQHLRTAMGSIVSGILSGYVSQIPHNLSTMKLLEPHRSYHDLWWQLARQSEKRVPDFVAEKMRPAVGTVLALAMPTGCLRRSLQIGGSFIIINGLIYSFRNKNWP